MTSDPHEGSSFETTRPSAPRAGWQGDVTAGVAAWTGGTPADAPDRVVTDRAVPPEDTLGPEADQEAVARKILLDQLTGQARSRHELADRLAKRNVPDEVATRLLDRFEEVGLVDDEAFARQWIASRQPGKGLARRALAQELRRKGVADEVAREALDEIDPDDEEAAARLLVRRKLRSMGGLDPAVATRRLAGMLARKGYPPGLAFAVVRDELDGVDDDASFDD
jgi:regulatory protein